MYGTITTIVVTLAGLFSLSDGHRFSRAAGLPVCAVPGPTVLPRPTGGPGFTAPASHWGGIPLHFEINRGQSAPEVEFVSRGRGYGLFLTRTSAVLTLSAPAQSTAVRLTFVDANPQPRVSPLNELPGKAHYLRGRDSRGWRTHIPTYATVRYHELYPGIDLVYHGNQQQLEYDLIVAPGRDPHTIAFRVGGVDRLEIDADGDLVLHTAGSTLRQHRPVIYQQHGDVRTAVDGRYVLRDTHEVGFAVAPYDTMRPLVIDPVIEYSSYLGGAATDRGNGIAVDPRGNVYMTGAAANDFPTANALQSNPAGLGDAWIAKVNAEGNALVYSTYLGGMEPDEGENIAVDTVGHAYVIGITHSPDFPTVNAAQPLHGGERDVFVAKLGPAGDTLIYSTYLGGGGLEVPGDIALDAAGHAYVSGQTGSSDFPAVNAFQSELRGNVDAFVTKLSRDGAAFVYSTHLGGTATEFGFGETAFGIAVNAAGQAYVTGPTASADFPTVNAFQPTFGGGASDAFVTKLDRDGSSLLFSTYLGGVGSELGLGVALDTSGRPVVVGSTGSTNFPTQDPLQPASAGFLDAFVTKFTASGARLIFSTYLGGGESEAASSVALDPVANVYITGTTGSVDFPVVDPLQADLSNIVDAFVTKISANGARLMYSTYLGGFRVDEGEDIAVDRAGSAYVVGTTMSGDFPVFRPLQATLGPDFDAFFAKITDFDLCLQDEHHGHALQIDTSTGGYQFSGCRDAGTVTRIGRGRITRLGAFVLLHDDGVFALLNIRLNAAFATVLDREGGFFVISDQDITNNTCRCD